MRVATTKSATSFLGHGCHEKQLGIFTACGPLVRFSGVFVPFCSVSHFSPDLQNQDSMKWCRASALGQLRSLPSMRPRIHQRQTKGTRSAVGSDGGLQQSASQVLSSAGSLWHNRPGKYSNQMANIKQGLFLGKGDPRKKRPILEIEAHNIAEKPKNSHSVCNLSVMISHGDLSRM